MHNGFDPREIVEEHGLDQLVGLSRREVTRLTGLGSHRAMQVVRYVQDHTDEALSTESDDLAAAKADAYTYSYNQIRDSYTFVWPGREDRPMVLAGEIVRSMINDYVEDGGNKPMHDVAIRHGVTRRDFEKIKTALGVTKRHEPFSPEEIREAPEDDLFDRSMEAKRQRLAARVDREEYRQVRDSAAKWVAFESRTLDPFAEKIKALLGGDIPARALPARLPTDESVIAHIHASDLHFGAYCAASFGGGGAYNRAVARERFLSGVSEAADRLSGRKIHYVILACGGDMVHSDNVHGKTTSFRHQMDLDGLPEEILVEAIDLYIQGVTILRSRGLKVHVEVVPGNHDYYTSIAMGKAAQVAFQHDSGVTFGNLIAPFAYHYFGDTAIVMHHGHGLHKASDLADNLHSYSRKHGRGYRHGYAITGNLHHMKVEEDPGIVLLQQPAPVEPDRYAATNGWTTARPAMIVYCFSARDGLLDQHHIWFDRR
jgi:hypothetical protein